MKPIKLKKSGSPDRRGQTSIANMSKARSVIKEALSKVRNDIIDTDSESDTESETKTETKTETKPETKPETKVDPETEYATLFHQREEKVRQELKAQYEEELNKKDLFYKEEIIKAKQGLMKNVRHQMMLKF